MPKLPMRIAYFGLPLGAEVLMRNGFVPAVIAAGHPDAPGMRRLRRRAARHPDQLILGRPDLSNASVVEAIASARPDVIFSWFWPFKIPANVLRLASRGAFGVHPSLLPRWRGRDPYFWAIKSGDAETGVTLHRLDAEYDTGAVVDTRTLAIRDVDTSWTLAKRLDRPSLALLLECARRLADGDALRGRDQSIDGVTHAPRPDDEDLVISFHESTQDVLRHIRAAAPEPGASAQLDDVVVTVLSAAEYRGTMPRALEPAEALLNESGVHIRTTDGAITLLRVRTEDDDVLEGDQIRKLFRK